MLELLEKAVITAIGAAAITQKKAEELAAEVKEKYKMSEDEGQHFVNRIQDIARDSRQRIQQMAEIEVQKVVEKLGLVTRDDYDRLAKRVQELEARLP